MLYVECVGNFLISMVGKIDVVFLKWKVVVIVLVFFCVGLIIVFVVVVVDFVCYKEKDKLE